VVGGSGGWNWWKLGSVVSSDLRLRPRLRLTSGEPNSVAAQYNRHSRAETCGLQCRTAEHRPGHESLQKRPKRRVFLA